MMNGMEDNVYNPMTYKDSLVGTFLLISMFGVFLVICLLLAVNVDVSFFTVFLWVVIFVVGFLEVMFIVNIFRGLRKFNITADGIDIYYAFKKYHFSFQELQHVKTNVVHGKIRIYRIYFVSPQGKKFYMPLSGKHAEQVYNEFTKRVNQIK